MNNYTLWELLSRHKSLTNRKLEIIDNIVRAKKTETVLNFAVELKQLEQEIRNLERIEIKTNYEL